MSEGAWTPPGNPNYYGSGGEIEDWLNQNLSGYLEANPTLIQAKSILGGQMAGFCPSGTVIDFAGSTAPTGWVLCDGTTYDAVTNPTLYLNLWNAIGTTYGGTGQSSFKVPDTQGRVAVGKGTNAACDVLGDNEGQATVASRKPSITATGTIGLESSHTHGPGTLVTGGSGNQGTIGSGGGWFMNLGQGTIVGTSGAGSSHTHTFSGSAANLGGFITFNKLIKL